MSAHPGGATAVPIETASGGSGDRQAFSSRSVFILAAIGSAVGLGNIWRYPYVAYESGGGAFLVPYLVALLTAAIPLLFLDYALGHKFRGSSPLSYSRLRRWLEPLGWVQVLLCFAISAYYAVVLAWALRYFLLSFTLGWGKDSEAFFFGDFLSLDETPKAIGTYDPGTFAALALIWVVCIGVVLFGIDRGIGGVNKVLLPTLFAAFVALVVRALFLEGAMAGLDAFFSPNWGALKDPAVWVAAYGQVFFSTSVAIGAMLTYASYLKLRTNLTGSGLVVAFSNASFEVLAGIGVFACIGFLAGQQGVGVDEAVAGGPGLAFVVFPALISEMPFGQFFGVLFFGCLVVAGVTSLVSLIQVVGAGVGEKFGMGHRAGTLVAGGATAAISLVFFPTSSGLMVLDVVDNWVNNVMLVGFAAISCLLVAWGARALPRLAHHLNAVGSFPVGWFWMLCVGVLTPAVLVYTVYRGIVTLQAENYEGYPSQFLNIFGWGMSGAIIVLAILLSFVPWVREEKLAPAYDVDDDDPSYGRTDIERTDLEGSRA
ncbi:neurotransmitter:Na+ symporter, NSS family [Kytococcus aerolatus]|uniref:Neurotransmitter:Na+ symporter, NSS family n=1 Tax=Kytococcus aerolatus TaxID=592308 RepID=A0A212TZR1_9MICO|nr:sodium-dependent transporter [Kytococcus aerolatus]SNC71371.1 neurotransmitter:Na+ symporter, NSS family [Kytococcus aerolatus]